MTQQKLSEKNQHVWDLFQAERLNAIYAKQEAKGERDKKAAMLNVNQYHEIAICLDGLQSDWSNLTLSQIEKVRELKPSKNNHLNGLLIACYVNNWLPINRDIAIDLIPFEYRSLVVKLVLQ
jgi:hypothetical protein